MQRQSGFSLVELMVSVVIGLVIIAALVALFLGTSRNNREMATANSLIENGRFSIQLLESDLIHAGYWGTHVPAFDDQTSDDLPLDVPGFVPDPCLAYTLLDWNSAYLDSLIGIPVQLYDAAAVCTGVVTNLAGSSDVLVVRHLEECAAGSADCPDSAGKLYLQATLCNTDPALYVFGATGTAAFTLTRRDCDPTNPAEKRRFISHIYYVRDYAVTAGDGVPTLVRSEFDLDPVTGTMRHLSAVALIEGVDALRVELGVDTVSLTGAPVDYTAAINWQDPVTKTRATNRGDGIPDGNFVRCTTAAPCTVAQLMNATAARIYVLARSRESTPGYVDTKTYTLGTSGTLGPFSDGFKRHLYAATVNLPNISGRRARP